jgi:hypothetical protein
MNITKRISLVAILVAISFGAVRAQNTATQTVQEGATIAQPICLFVVTGLQFGAILTGSSSGTVHVAATSNSWTETASGAPGPVLYTGSHGGVTPASIASFTVSGEPGLDYTIAYSGPSIITNTSNSSKTMSIAFDAPHSETVNGITPSTTLTGTSSPYTATSTITTDGTDAWVVGGTLSVGANQASGNYTGSFSVTIAYD